MQIEALLPIDKFIKDIEDRFSQSDVELISESLLLLKNIILI